MFFPFLYLTNTVLIISFHIYNLSVPEKMYRNVFHPVPSAILYIARHSVFSSISFLSWPSTSAYQPEPWACLQNYPYRDDLPSSAFLRPFPGRHPFPGHLPFQGLRPLEDVRLPSFHCLEESLPF